MNALAADHDRGARTGFTLVELVVVVAVVALLAALAAPNLQRALLRARATEAVADLHTARLAVLGYLGDHHRYPPDNLAGSVPTELRPYLPENFSFVGEGYLLDYDEWTSGPGFVAMSVITDDRDLGLMVLDMLGPDGFTNGARLYSWIIEWTD
ncbi:MAG: prepilin-type N-terminal cleavage/methylation domain-containing protein [Longimicrobiales bacterium]